MNTVYGTEKFNEVYQTLEKFEQEWITKIKDQLSENLYVGKPLCYPWFREKKLGDRRLLFLINFITHTAVIISYATKKEQQKSIDHILLHQKEYLMLIS